MLIEEIIEVFLQTLLTLLNKKKSAVTFIPKYVPFTGLPDVETKILETVKTK